MKKVSELFTANACNPWEVANNLSKGSGGVGFRIPEYQRTYDWSKENIHRLMTDIFTGFERLSHGTEANSFTFLGTLILVEDQIQEDKFKGQSFSIVDGQQRLTTLTLLACALIERLRFLYPELPKLSSKTSKWLEIEAEWLEEALASCIRGTQLVQSGQMNYPFPRIVRDYDFRADSTRHEQLKSEIAIFLKKFVDFIQSDQIEFQIPDMGKTREEDKIKDNFHLIRKYCENLNDRQWFVGNDCQFIDSERFTFGGNKQLWIKTQDVLMNDGSQAISEIQKKTDAHPYYRTLMLAAYFCKCIALTTVITDDEGAAFDIFDALNTTGEPLTALETLKPHVINTLKDSKSSGFSGSRCEIAFKSIDERMAKHFPETSQKQDETKNLIITFKLYLDGKKTSLNLNAQRNDLRSLFNNSKNIEDGPTKFMEYLDYVSEYRCDYYTSRNIGKINISNKEQNDAELVKLLCSLIIATKTHLTLPILARYWIDGKIKGIIYQSHILP